jgi:hypothetical protein
MVIFQNPEGDPGYNQFESIEEAVSFVEKIRNEQGIDSIRTRAEEVKFDLKPYFGRAAALKAGARPPPPLHLLLLRHPPCRARPGTRLPPRHLSLLRRSAPSPAPEPEPASLFAAPSAQPDLPSATCRPSGGPVAPHAAGGQARRRAAADLPGPSVADHPVAGRPPDCVKSSTCVAT